MVRNFENNDFNDSSSSDLSKIFLNSEPAEDNRAVTKNYYDSLTEKQTKRRDLSTVFNYQDKESDKSNLTNLDSITVNRNPTSVTEFSIKKYVEDEIIKNTILRFNQSQQNYLKVTVGNTGYNLTNYD